MYHKTKDNINITNKQSEDVKEISDFLHGVFLGVVCIVPLILVAFLI